MNDNYEFGNSLIKYPGEGFLTNKTGIVPLLPRKHLFIQLIRALKYIKKNTDLNSEILEDTPLKSCLFCVMSELTSFSLTLFYK